MGSMDTLSGLMASLIVILLLIILVIIGLAILINMYIGSLASVIVLVSGFAFIVFFLRPKGQRFR